MIATSLSLIISNHPNNLKYLSLIPYSYQYFNLIFYWRKPVLHAGTERNNVKKSQYLKATSTGLDNDSQHTTPQRILLAAY